MYPMFLKKNNDKNTHCHDDNRQPIKSPPSINDQDDVEGGRAEARISIGEKSDPSTNAIKELCQPRANKRREHPNTLGLGTLNQESKIQKTMPIRVPMTVKEVENMVVPARSEDIPPMSEKDLDLFTDPLFNGQTKIIGPDNWWDSLLDYINNPGKYVDETIASDKACVVIRDKYQKAKHHYLIIPRRPIDTLSALTKKDLPLLKHMIARGEWLVERFSTSPANNLHKFRLGFHAIPSLSQLHMHVISQDFDSFYLKNKKHWNTFTTSFFLDAQIVVSMIESRGYVE
eukprot:Ihof_evm2s690 gene=Ihof_evmTU2s690